MKSLDARKCSGPLAIAGGCLSWREEEGRGWLAQQEGLAGGGDKLQDVAALLPKRRNDGQNALHEETAGCALGPKAPPPPEHKSLFILPMLKAPPGSTTRGTLRSASPSPCSTVSTDAASRWRSAKWRMVRARWYPPGCWTRKRALT